MAYTDESCPKCGGKVTMEAVCPGFTDRGQWLHCYPACGNAFLYECDKIVVCGWWFIDGMNARNVLFSDNEIRRPTWLAK